jgi:hypothetical protein
VSVAKRIPAQFSNVLSETAGGVSRTYGGMLGGSAATSRYSFTGVETMLLDRYRLNARP